MRAILIDPEAKTISEFDLPTGYEHILSTIDAELFTGVDLGEVAEKGDITMYVDDEGHLHPGKAVFFIAGHAIAGKGVVTLTDEEGETVALPPSVSVEQIQAQVEFSEQESTGEFGPSSEGYIDHPLFGRMFQVIGGQPVLAPRGTFKLS